MNNNPASNRKNSHQQHQSANEPRAAANFSKSKPWKKVICSEDGLSVQYFIYPYSMHTNDTYNFQRPIEIGFTLSERRKLKFEGKNKKGAKYLVLPEVCTDLNYDLKPGFSQFVDAVMHQNGLDSLLKFIIENKQALVIDQLNNSSNKLLKPDFICWRGLITSLLTTPYEKDKDLQFAIIPYKGSFYMCEIYTELAKQQKTNRDEKSRQFEYWGHKFEGYITADDPNEKPNGLDEIPDCEDYIGTVVGTNLNEHCLMYGAEIDCCLTTEHNSLNNYCEIKTSRGKSREDLNFERNPKFFKWWLQSYLVDIQNIQVGLRDDNGIVTKIVKCNTDNMYAAVTKRSNDNLCFNFMNGLLKVIRRFCHEEEHLYIAERTLNSESIIIRKVTDKASKMFLDNYFLTDWYKQAMN